MSAASVLPIALLMLLVTATQGIRPLMESTDHSNGHESDQMLAIKTHQGAGSSAAAALRSKISSSNSGRGLGRMVEKEERVKSSSEQKAPDMVDLTRMDYSMAKRKPPTHN